MKTMKRIAVFILVLCLVLPVYSVISYAANGEVSFTDPEAKTGETVEVTCALRAGGKSLDSFEITVKYDSAYLYFEGGDSGVTKESEGVLKFSGSGDGSNRIGFTMKFQALQVGTTTIEVTESAGTVEGGETVNCTNGNSTIQIQQGTTPVNIPTDTADNSSAGSAAVTIGDKTYTCSESFKSSDMPVGFVETTLTYNGGERKFIQQESGSIVLGYLIDSEGKGDFYLYNKDDATFSVYEQIAVSPTASIVLLMAEEGLKIPDGYQEVKLTLNGNEFPAWQDTAHEGFYLVYAMNANGEKAFYQYDTVEQSYQRYITRNAVSEEKEDKKGGKLFGFIESNFLLVGIGAGALLLLLIIIIVILAVKLRSCNRELDDLYGQGGYDDGDEEDLFERGEERKIEKRGKFRKSDKDDDFDYFSADLDDDFSAFSVDDDFDDSGYNDSDFDDEYYEDEDEDSDEDFFDDGDDDEFEDEDFELDEADFGVDFIDLD